ncbi:MAG TPA: radical SAM family heme chaperone HemW, partial [Candidatus Baltobacteraceae bacterium]|nr:radical SAM family heme chaperone HemW [Candidatus Baltobacteraceae bacterium]
MTQGPGLYVHLPFCPYLCPYCDFAKWPLRASSAQRYLQALYAQIERAPEFAAATAFLGGGTPNAYDVETIARLTETLRERFLLPENAEISIEINPELVRDGDFDRYRAAGITRVSIGVQSFEPGEVRVLGRKHTVDRVQAVVEAARASGMPSIGIDLMFAVPGQTVQSWERSLQRAVDLDIDHVSTYGLTVEEGTPYATWQAREPQAFFDDAGEAELYASAIQILSAAGYEQYEISNFARRGHRCAHNANYWANGEYLGLGVGAASYRDGVRWVSTRSLDAYVSAALELRPIPVEAER